MVLMVGDDDVAWREIGYGLKVVVRQVMVLMVVNMMKVMVLE